MSRKRLEDLAPEQFSSILILADESAPSALATQIRYSPRTVADAMPRPPHEHSTR